MTPNFDEIVGSELSDAEREKLRQVHELLVVAGPPPELPPRLEQAPDLENVHGLPRRKPTRRPVILLAAALAVFAVFFAGYATGSHGTAAAQSLTLLGTKVVPSAYASLQIQPEQQGNSQMTLTVARLPKLPAHTYYEVYLVRNGKPWGSCGTFRITNPSLPTTIKLNAPYPLRSGDSWVVTRERPGERGPGQTVLRPSGRV